MDSVNLPQQTERWLAVKEAIDQGYLVEDREICEESFFEFFRGAWPSISNAEFKSCFVVEAFCDHLEAVTLGHIKRLLANFPPRSSKTSILSIAWPAWIWARSQRTFLSGPQVKILSASYNDKLALEHANLTRRLILSPWYQARWGDRFRLRPDQNTKSLIDNTMGGSRRATSVRGGLLGLGGDVICVDDPHNTETEKKVESDADRRAVAGWWQELSSTRLNDPKQGAIVVTMQRLHSGDLSGIILDSDEEFVHYMVPMEMELRRRCVTVVLPQYEGDEPWTDPRTEEGELMWPERFGPKEVRRIKERLGPFMAAGRLQQAPVPKGGGILQRDWWQLWDNEAAAKYGLEWTRDRKEFPHCELIIGSLDTSYGEKDENSYNAMTVWGIFLDQNQNRRAMLMFAWQKRLKLHGKVISAKPGEARANFDQRQKEEWGLVEWVADTCKRYKVQRLLIEDKTRGRDVANEIKRLYVREEWGIELLKVVGDKIARTHAVVPMFADGAIWAPETKWSDEVLTQCSLFPKGEFADLHDTVTQAVGWLRDRGLLLRGDEMSAVLEDEMTYHGRTESVAEQYGV